MTKPHRTLAELRVLLKPCTYILLAVLSGPDPSPPDALVHIIGWAPPPAPFQPPPRTRSSPGAQPPTSAQIPFNQQPQQSFASPVIKPSVWSQPSSPYGDLAHAHNPSTLGKWLQGYLERIPMPTTVHSSRGSPSLPATHCSTHAARKFCFGRGKAEMKTAWQEVWQHQPWSGMF